MSTAQYNPSTLKASYDSNLAKMIVHPPTGEDCEYCTPGTAPEYITVTPQNLTFCSGCYALDEHGQGDYYCNGIYGSVLAKYGKYSSDTLNGLSFLLPHSTPDSCEWYYHFNPYTTPSINFNGGFMYNGSNCDDYNYCEQATNLYFYVYNACLLWEK